MRIENFGEAVQRIAELRHHFPEEMATTQIIHIQSETVYGAAPEFIPNRDTGFMEELAYIFDCAERTTVLHGNPHTLKKDFVGFMVKRTVD